MSGGGKADFRGSHDVGEWNLTPARFRRLGEPPKAYLVATVLHHASIIL